MPRSRPTTPVRRVSRGSISSHHRASLSGGTAAGNSVGAGAGQGTTPLSFLTQAMGDLAYETATLQSNLEAIDEIQGALHTFDESFSMFLYGLKMNAFCVEWPEAPGEENFDRAEMRKAQTLDFTRLGQRDSYAPTIGDGSAAYDATTMTGPADQTYMTQDEEDVALMQRRPTTNVRNAGPPATKIKPALKSAMKKPHDVGQAGAGTAKAKAVQATADANAAPPKAKITAAERKRREAAAEQVIESLPLEYRGGSDPSAKQLASRVILALIAAGPKGVRINQIVRAPDLPQAKVNKCMIALVNAKQVTRRSENGVVYQLDPEKNPIAA